MQGTDIGGYSRQMPLTPQSKLRDLIVLALGRLGGAGKRADVLAEADRMFGEAFTAEDRAPVPSRQFEESWRNRASFERAEMVRDGLLTERADGVWELNHLGNERLNELSGAPAARQAQTLAAPVVRSTEKGHGYWWQHNVSENVWMEITRRDDIGTDLKAPSAARGGVTTASYALVPLVQPGDVVVHYDSHEEAIVGVSVAASAAEPAPIYWVARGSYARRAGERPRWLPGLRVISGSLPAARAAGNAGRNPPQQGRPPRPAPADPSRCQRAADLLSMDPLPGHAPHVPELPGEDASRSHQPVSSAPSMVDQTKTQASGLVLTSAAEQAEEAVKRCGGEGRTPRQRARIPARPGSEGGGRSTRDEHGHRVLQPGLGRRGCPRHRELRPHLPSWPAR